MKETRQLSINFKMISRNDIINVGNVILEEFHQSQTLGNKPSIRFRIKCNDGTSYESDQMNIYLQGDIIDIKKADSIEIMFYDYVRDRHINFQISEGCSSSYNYITISGENRNWVGGIFTKLKDIIDTIKPQENWPFKYKSLLFHIAAIGIGTILLHILAAVISRTTTPTPDAELSANTIAFLTFVKAYPIVGVIIGNIVIPWWLGLVGALSLRDWLVKLWNNIEFDFGPEHLKLNKLRRQRIFIFGTVVVVPILWDAIKYLFF